MSREKTLAYNLYKAREAKGLTQQEVSKLTGLTVPSISRYESGERIPRVTVAKVLSDVYGVTLDDLFES